MLYFVFDALTFRIACLYYHLTCASFRSKNYVVEKWGSFLSISSKSLHLRKLSPQKTCFTLWPKNIEFIFNFFIFQKMTFF